MLAIKLQRVGKKHQPSYRMVVAEKRSKLIGPPIEDLGAYSTMTKEGAFNNERISYWIGAGAQPTMTVHNLLVKQGILKAPTKAIKMNKPKPKEAAPAEAAKAAEPVAEAKPVEAEAVAEVKPAEPEPVAEVKEEAVAEAKTEVVAEAPKEEEKPADA